MKNPFLKALFIIFIGILVALFVGIGIDTFYPAPERPEYPDPSKSKEVVNYVPIYVAKDKVIPAKDTQERLQEEQQEYQKALKNYKEETKTYDRNVSIIAMIASVIVVVISLLFLTKIDFIADGLLLGGIATLMYSLARGFKSEDSIFRFIVVAISLAVVLIVSYFRFIRKKK